ncbi:MAG: pilus assembly protein N-terminal domain-containing protein, partial [Thermoguttaceae bacterium]
MPGPSEEEENDWTVTRKEVTIAPPAPKPQSAPSVARLQQDGVVNMAQRRSSSVTTQAQAPAAVPTNPPAPRVTPSIQPTPAAPKPKVVGPMAPPPAPRGPAPLVADGGMVGPFEVIEESGEMTVMLRRSKLLRTRVDIYRTAVVDPSICDVVQFTPREVSIIGKGQGATHITFWFDDLGFRPITYLVRVVPDPEVQKRREEQYGLMAERLAELFP